MVILYSKPACPACSQTERQFKKKEIAYDKIDVTQDSAAYERIVALGYRSFPVVVDGDRHWSGFDPEAIALCQV